MERSGAILHCWKILTASRNREAPIRITVKLAHLRRLQKRTRSFVILAAATKEAAARAKIPAAGMNRDLPRHSLRM